MKVTNKIKVYLITCSKGSWDDWHQWACAVFLNKKLAENYVEKKNEQIRRLKSMIPQGYTEWWASYGSGELEYPNSNRYYDLNQLNDDFEIKEMTTI